MSERTGIRETKQESAGKHSVSTAERTGHARAVYSPAGRVLFLQRTIGNQAVQRLFKAGLMQAKLKVGAPNDVYEQEADRVAEQVMRMPDTVIGNQRSAVGKESAIQLKPG